MLSKNTHKSEVYNTSLIVLFLIFLLPLSATAASVTGKYTRVSGNTTIFEISVGTPSPSSVIVEQSLSSKNKVQSASPKPKKISGNGNIKWLLTNTRSGKQQFTVKMANPIKGSVRAMIRYRDPESGKFIEQSITQ